MLVVFDSFGSQSSVSGAGYERLPNAESLGKAHALVLEIYKLTTRFPVEERFGLTIQMRRSGAAIPTHLAEGCGADNDQDMARLFQLGMRSACELEYQLLLSRDLTYTPLELYAELEPRVIEVKKMLTSYIQRVRAGNH